MLLPRSRALVAALAVTLFGIACSDGTSPPVASSVQAASATTQQGVVGTAVGAAPSVTVRDQNDAPMPGVPVSFSVTAGGGSITPASITTGADGIARTTTWTLGTAAGTHTATATVSGLSPITFSATAVAGAAANLAKQAGDNQPGTVGTAVATAPSVLVTDAHGNPVAGVEVTFEVASGGGSVSGSPAVTNASGIATAASWTLGTVAGPNTLTASATGLTPVTFTATAAAGPPASIAKETGDNQSAAAGTVVAVAPSVLVTDAHGNPVSGASVTFAVASGGGSAGGSPAVTNASGIATVGSWTLGTAIGTNTLTASVTGITAVTFTATAVTGPAANISKQAGDNQSATAGTAVSVAPSVLVTDAHGNPVAGVSVTFSVASGGGSVSGSPAVTNASGIATVGSWTLGTATGTNTLTASVSGLTAVTFTATAVAGPAANIAKQAGDNQSALAGTTVSVAPSALVTDSHGNPVAGASVSFTPSGNGAVTGSPAITNSSGVATVGSWTLSTTVGANTLTGAVSGVTPVVFNATGTAPGSCGAPTPLPVPSSIDADLATGDCVVAGALADHYSTTTTAAQAVIFTLTSTQFDAFLAVSSATDVLVAANDNTGVGTTNSAIKLIAAAGSHTVTATTATAGQQGSYTIAAASTSASANNCERVFIEIGVTTSQSLDVTDCQTFSDFFYDDLFLVYLPSGATIRIRQNSAVFDTYLTLYDAAGNFVDEDDDSGGGTNSELTFTATTAGFYFISAGSFDSDVTGAYTLSVETP